MTRWTTRRGWARRRTAMLRNTAIALAAASLFVAASLPTGALAFGRGAGGHWGVGFGHGWYAFFFYDPATTEIYTLSLHDALPICAVRLPRSAGDGATSWRPSRPSRISARSEEHTSELQSRRDLVCRLLLEKKKKKPIRCIYYKQKKK